MRSAETLECGDGLSRKHIEPRDMSRHLWAKEEKCNRSGRLKTFDKQVTSGLRLIISSGRLLVPAMHWRLPLDQSRLRYQDTSSRIS